MKFKPNLKIHQTTIQTNANKCKQMQTFGKMQSDPKLGFQTKKKITKAGQSGFDLWLSNAFGAPITRMHIQMCVFRLAKAKDQPFFSQTEIANQSYQSI